MQDVQSTTNRRNVFETALGVCAMTDTTKLSRFEELELIEGLLEFRLELRANASDALAEISQLGPDASDSLLISEGIDPGRLKRRIINQRAGSARTAT